MRGSLISAHLKSHHFVQLVHSVPITKTYLARHGSHRIPSAGLWPMPSAALLSSIHWSRQSHNLQSFQGRAKVGPSSQCLGEYKGLVCCWNGSPGHLPKLPRASVSHCEVWGHINPFTMPYSPPTCSPFLNPGFCFSCPFIHPCEKLITFPSQLDVFSVLLLILTQQSASSPHTLL